VHARENPAASQYEPGPFPGRQQARFLLSHAAMTTEDLTKRLRVVEGLLRDHQFEFALALAIQLDSAIDKLSVSHQRVVPVSVRTHIEWLRTEAEAGIQAAA
jgi:hypothetical protein